MERIENCEMIKAEIVNTNRLEMKFCLLNFTVRSTSFFSS